MYKKFIELKNWWRVLIKGQNENNEVQVSIKDKKWNLIIESNLCHISNVEKTIKRLIPKDSIEDEVEDYN
jgi:hypothetical protein